MGIKDIEREPDRQSPLKQQRINGAIFTMTTLEAERNFVCDSFARGQLAFNDAYYLLTTMHKLTPHMAVAYLAGAKLKVTPMRRCTSLRTHEDYCSGGPQVPCQGYQDASGEFHNLCGEPCRWTMQKSGEGSPPWQ